MPRYSGNRFGFAAALSLVSLVFLAACQAPPASTAPADATAAATQASPAVEATEPQDSAESPETIARPPLRPKPQPPHLPPHQPPPDHLVLSDTAPAAGEDGALAESRGDLVERSDELDPQS